jgi:AhpC/TSA family
MERALLCRLAWLFAALLALGASHGAAAQPAVLTLDGRVVDPLADVPKAPATVFVFTATDCPISNRYAPELKRLADRFAPDEVRVHLVYANPAETPASIQVHLARFGYTMEALRDPKHDLVRFAKVTIAPEVAVFDRAGRQVYRGRIDDRFVDIGIDRQVPLHRDLEDALTAIVAGRAVATPTTRAVGCFLADFLR